MFDFDTLVHKYTVKLSTVPNMVRRHTLSIILILIIILAAFIRLHGLSRLGLGFDEPTDIYAAKGILQFGKPILPSGLDYNRALPFAYVVAFSFKLFGINELAARLPSVVFGLFSIVLMFFIGNRFFNRRTGLIAALLMTFMPFEVVWARACRLYSMYQFFFLAGFFAFYSGFENSKLHAPSMPGHYSNKKSMISDWNLNWVWLVLSGISLLIAYRLQPLAMAFGVSLVLYFLWMLTDTLLSGGFKELLNTKYFYFFLFSTGSALILLFGFHMWDEVVSLVTYSAPWSHYMDLSPTYYLRRMMDPVQFPIFVFMILGTIQIISRKNNAGIYTLIAAYFPFSFHSLVVDQQSFRYIYDIYPLFLLVAAYAVSNFLESELSDRYFKLNAGKDEKWAVIQMRRMLPVLLIFIFCIPFGYSILNAARISLNKSQAPFGGEYHAQWKEACEFVKEHRKPDELIITDAPLAAEYRGCGRTDYMLDNGEIDNFRPPKGNGFALDVYTDAKAITNLEQFRAVLTKNPKGWLLVDRQRFINPGAVPTDVKDFITEHLIAHTTPADRTMVVFSWGTQQETSHGGQKRFVHYKK